MSADDRTCYCGAPSEYRFLPAVQVVALTALALLALFGCSAPTDATPTDDPATISMWLEGVPVTRAAIVGMLPANTLRFSATMKDPAGRTMGSARPTVVSRNANVISIDAAGLMRVAGRGSTWMVAGYISPTRGLISDSVTVVVVCTTQAVAGLQVTVSDSVTGLVAGITSLSISARLGTVRDSVFFAAAPASNPTFTQALAVERPGTWDVRVTAAGYQPWAALGVVVGADLCHVIPVTLSARLQKN